MVEGKPSQSNSPSSPKESVRQLLGLLNIENEYARFLAYMKIQRPDHIPKIRTLYDEFFSDSAYNADVAQVYLKHFNPEEIAELIKFYSSPLGKKIIHLTNNLHKIMEDTMLTKISDYIFTSNENGYDVSFLQK